MGALLTMDYYHREPTGNPQGTHREPTGNPQGSHREPSGLTTGLCINDGNNQTNVEEFKAMMIGNVNVKIT